MTIYAHAPEYHIQNRSETEKQLEPETTTTPGADAESAESSEGSLPLCDTFGEETSQGATGGTSEHTSCPPTSPTATNSATAYLPVGESLFGLIIVTPFLLHFLKRKFS